MQLGAGRGVSTGCPGSRFFSLCVRPQNPRPIPKRRAKHPAFNPPLAAATIVANSPRQHAPPPDKAWRRASRTLPQPSPRRACSLAAASAIRQLNWERREPSGLQAARRSQILTFPKASEARALPWPLQLEGREGSRHALQAARNGKQEASWKPLIFCEHTQNAPQCRQRSCQV
ncbi:Hypothetical predicted protein [Marmota monax]|uniref:Uncharacterized protein n=1 Tax=Marmota monax TaxID=9995 RepID=A0A5E4AYB5_MARMO|nr:hypothetical protein GHT09_012222 [Marmota monax]VTJ62384.1 Hypothetical predicted protein [Marmota monax]